MLTKRSKETGERIVSIFFEADKDICHTRMAKERGEDAAKSRTAQYETFLGAKKKAEYIIDSTLPLSETVKELYEIFQTEIMSQSLH